MNDPDDPDRLGPRRSARDYSVHQRRTGKTAAEILLEKDLLRVASVLLLVMAVTYNSVASREIFFSVAKVVALSLLAVAQINCPRLCIPRTIAKRDISWESFDAQDYVEMFGMEDANARDIYEAMDIPDRLLIGEVGTKHAFHVSGVHAFLYLLFRMYSHSQRMQLDAKLWGYDCSTLSKIWNALLVLVDDKHRHRLQQLPSIAHKFPEFNAKIYEKMRKEVPAHVLMPPHVEHCALFGDGSRFRCARPYGIWEIQAGAFSGDKWFHCQGCQGIFVPDGMFYDWWDAPLGKDTDKYYMRDLKVNAILQHIQLGQPTQHWVYLDAGYSNDRHCRVASHGPAPVTPAQSAPV
ncbi:hypothetical protein B484DRAFT_400202 [Ochromonadaceae sp. CCMP2298]|nr:hypothetical protein B484DRAFT_400202 [Ochromonadaceae sp. CCMP2298]